MGPLSEKKGLLPGINGADIGEDAWKPMGPDVTVATVDSRRSASKALRQELSDRPVWSQYGLLTLVYYAPTSNKHTKL